MAVSNASGDMAARGSSKTLSRGFPGISIVLISNYVFLGVRMHWTDFSRCSVEVVRWSAACAMGVQQLKRGNHALNPVNRRHIMIEYV